MADPLSVVASVISIADAGIKLASNLYSYSDCAWHAEKQVRDIARETRATSSVLRELGQVLESDAKIKLCSPNAFLTAQEALKECNDVFGEIDQALKRHQKDAPKPSVALLSLTKFGRLAWPLKKEKMDLLRSNLEKLKSTLILMLQVLGYARILACEKPDDSQINQLQQRIEELARANEESTKKYELLRTRLRTSVAQRKRYHLVQNLPLDKEAADAPPCPITMRTVVAPPQDCLVTALVPPGSHLERDDIIRPSSNDQSEIWSLDQVLLWLERRGFSIDWQKAFMTLGLHGPAFLDIVRRQNVAFLFNVVLPEVKKQCIQNGTGWDAKREREEREESLRLRKEILVLLETGRFPRLSLPLHHQELSSTAGSDVLSAQDLERCLHLITTLLEHVENAQQALTSQITTKGHPRATTEDVYARVRGDLDKIIMREPGNPTLISRPSIALDKEDAERAYIEKAKTKAAAFERHRSDSGSNESLTVEPKPRHAQHAVVSRATPLVIRHLHPPESEAQKAMFPLTRSNRQTRRPTHNSGIPSFLSSRHTDGESSRWKGQQAQGAEGSYRKAEEMDDEQVSLSRRSRQAEASRPRHSEPASYTVRHRSKHRTSPSTSPPRTVPESRRKLYQPVEQLNRETPRPCRGPVETSVASAPTRKASRPVRQRRSPTLEFSETPLELSKSPVISDSEYDDDSDDGLCLMKISDCMGLARAPVALEAPPRPAQSDIVTALLAKWTTL